MSHMDAVITSDQIASNSIHPAFIKMLQGLWNGNNPTRKSSNNLLK